MSNKQEVIKYTITHVVFPKNPNLKYKNFPTKWKKVIHHPCQLVLDNKIFENEINIIHMCQYKKTKPFPI
jgi:hypothetical protein